MNTCLSDQRYALIQPAFDRAVDTYIRTRRERIPGFVQEHFSFTSALKINRKALGSDLIKAPLNVAWALPYTAVQATSLLCNKVGLKRTGQLAKKMPTGFTTAVQHEINKLIYIRLLELPYHRNNEEYRKDALLVEILNQPELEVLIRKNLDLISLHSQQEGFRESLEKRLQEYAVSRTAIAELSSNIIAMASGATMLSKMTPGGISFGAALSATIAQQSAISGFIFGPTLGGMYYSLFPASASLGLALATTGGVMAGLAVVSAFSGVLTDPLQARLGTHEKRLNQLVDNLEDSLTKTSAMGLKLKEQYLVRIFDLVDLLKTAANTIV